MTLVGNCTYSQDKSPSESILLSACPISSRHLRDVTAEVDGAGMNPPMNGLAGLNMNAQRGMPSQVQQLGRVPSVGQPQQPQQQSVMSAEALYLAQLQRMNQSGQAPPQHQAASAAGQPSFLHLLQQGGASRPAGAQCLLCRITHTLSFAHHSRLK